MADSSVISEIFEDRPILDSSIRKFEYLRQPAKETFLAGENPAEITIEGGSDSLDYFALLDRSYIALKIAMLQADGTTALSTTTRAQYIQQGWHMFSSAALAINGSEVEVVTNPGDIAAERQLIESTSEYIKSQGAMESFYPQTADALFTDLNDTANEFTADTNIARATRRYRSAGNHTLNLMLRHVFGIATVKKCLPGVRISLRLTPETVFEKVIRRSASSLAAVVRIKACELQLATVRPDQNELARVYAEFNGGATIPLEFEKVKSYNLPLLDTDASKNVAIPHSFKRITGVNVLIQLNSQFSGATAAGTGFRGDKLAGNLCAMTKHAMHVGGRQYPQAGYAGSVKNYVQEYQTYLQVGGKHNNDIYGAPLDYDLWTNCYPYFCYDLSTLRDEMAGVRLSAPTLEWEAEFAAPGAAATAKFFIHGKEIRHLNMVNGSLMVTTPSFSD